MGWCGELLVIIGNSYARVSRYAEDPCVFEFLFPFITREERGG